MRDVLSRFWAKVAVLGPDECWRWLAGGDQDGYGHFFVSRNRHVSMRAHRFALEIATRSPIPVGMCVLHSCDTPSCVNPAHLRVGTRADNMRDCIERKRHPLEARTHCRNGHPFNEENTYRDPIHGYRHCQACRRARAVAKIGGPNGVELAHGSVSQAERSVEPASSETSGAATPHRSAPDTFSVRVPTNVVPFERKASA